DEGLERHASRAAARRVFLRMRSIRRYGVWCLVSGDGRAVHTVRIARCHAWRMRSHVCSISAFVMLRRCVRIAFASLPTCIRRCFGLALLVLETCDFLVAALLVIAVITQFEELAEDGLDCCLFVAAMRPHATLNYAHIERQRRFACHIPPDHPAVD